jgi:hypothetical protein
MVSCGRIWIPLCCKGLTGSGATVTTADVYPASRCGRRIRGREPRWIFACFHSFAKSSGDRRLRFRPLEDGGYQIAMTSSVVDCGDGSTRFRPNAFAR